LPESAIREGKRSPHKDRNAHERENRARRNAYDPYRAQWLRFLGPEIEHQQLNLLLIQLSFGWLILGRSLTRRAGRRSRLLLRRPFLGRSARLSADVPILRVLRGARVGEVLGFAVFLYAAIFLVALFLKLSGAFLELIALPGRRLESPRLAPGRRRPMVEFLVAHVSVLSLPSDQMSRNRTSLAWLWMNSFRGST
jgi:hypothetical protein